MREYGRAVAFPEKKLGERYNLKPVEKWLIGVAASLGAAAICGYNGVNIIAINNPFYIGGFCLRDALFIGCGMSLSIAAYFMYGVWYTLREKTEVKDNETNVGD